MKKIEFVLYENGKTLDTIEKETYTEGTELVKSLEEFRQIINLTLTKKIEDGEILEDYIEDDFDSSEGGEETVQPINPKKRKI
ncbi:unnamed protein product [Euphydryas editha]|uniref:Uncharacterized protein n=1 Tax=Euphydryas editha TaxID=104508 RepID=A0AAU9TK25_EUPED|nr:unnamed protein product [Euphydryas editha]